MIDAKVLEGVKNWLSIYGRLTCGILAEKMNMPPSSMVYFLRDAVDAGVLTECNGFYDIPRPRPVQPVRRKCSRKVRLMMFSGAASESPCRGLRGMIFRRWRGNLLRAY